MSLTEAIELGIFVGIGLNAHQVGSVDRLKKIGWVELSFQVPRRQVRFIE